PRSGPAPKPRSGAVSAPLENLEFLGPLPKVNPPRLSVNKKATGIDVQRKRNMKSHTPQFHLVNELRK
ncbi:hypothetical protein LEMLEM_LOCUS21605, partial [Lemmus lemmus]